MKTQLILMRHGQPELQNCLLGKTDSKLSELGWQQMQSSCLSLKNIDQVISSSLMRCKQFAVTFAIKNGIPFECDERWQECDFGDWDGISYDHLNKNQSTEFKLFLQSPNDYSSPNGERLVDFNNRVDQALEQIFERYKGKRVLLFTHGGVIRSLVARCLKIDRLSNIAYQNLKVDYASQTEIDIYHGKEKFFRLNSLNILPQGFF